MNSEKDDRDLVRLGIWLNRDAVLEGILLHEPDCFHRQVQEAGIRLANWDVKEFISAALLDDATQLGIYTEE